jgi:chromosome segregation ATPase
VPVRPRARPIEAPKPEPAPEPVPVNGDVLRLSWRLYGAVEAAALTLKWASTADALDIHDLRVRLARAIQEVKRLSGELEAARREMERAERRVEAAERDGDSRVAAAQRELEQARARVADLEDDTEALTVLLSGR